MLSGSAVTSTSTWSSLYVHWSFKWLSMWWRKSVNPSDLRFQLTVPLMGRGLRITSSVPLSSCCRTLAVTAWRSDSIAHVRSRCLLRARNGSAQKPATLLVIPSGDNLVVWGWAGRIMFCVGWSIQVSLSNLKACFNICNLRGSVKRVKADLVGSLKV